MVLWVGRRCPYESDLSESENESPYQNDQNRWDLNELKWIEWNEWNEWIEGIDLEQPYGSDLSESENECPYQNEWNRWEMNELKWIEVKWVIWRKWARTTLWEWSYGRVKVSLSKWLDLFVVTKSFQNDQNRWEMNELSEMKWNDGFDGFDFVNPMRVTWVNPMGKSLWVENECPYQFDLIDLSEKVPMFSWMNVPIKVT